ncbi:MAG TPA: amidohydrolase family protein [Pseudomonadales bacterium]|nr:amidohydrolase family protein [Pseudomonadales bacterium]
MAGNRFGYDSEGKDAWLAQVQEPVLLPEQPIIDAHHHLWIRDGDPYLLRELAADLNSGHRIVGTVYEECGSMYRRTGPEAMRPVGEMEFVAGVAAMSSAGAFDTHGVCTAAVGWVDLTLGAAVEPVLEALVAASGGRMRGVRAQACWDASERIHSAAGGPDLLDSSAVRDAIGVLARMGLVLDCWLYHPQLSQLVRVADAFPDLAIVLDHVGTPIVGGPYRDQLDAVRADWSTGMRALAERANVTVKLGALAAKFDGPNRQRSLPPTAEDVERAWAPWMLPCIEWFGARRCMFESNFPVHRNWLSYATTWNAFKRMTMGASVDERDALFAGTAARVYAIERGAE